MKHALLLFPPSAGGRNSTVDPPVKLCVAGGAGGPGASSSVVLRRTKLSYGSALTGHVMTPTNRWSSVGEKLTGVELLAVLSLYLHVYGHEQGR